MRTSSDLQRKAHLPDGNVGLLLYYNLGDVVVALALFSSIHP